MRKLTILAVLLAACGGSSSAPRGPSGTIAGKSFSPAELGAVSAGPATCQVSDPTGQTTQKVSVNAAAIAFTFASYTGICADFSSPFCTVHQSSEQVTLLLAALDFAGGTARVAPGTYTLASDITRPTFNLAAPGTATIAYATSLATTATCTPTGDGGGVAVAQGTLRLDAVDASHAAGHVDLTFSDGGKVSGDFSAPVCAGLAPDICAITSSQGTCAGTPACK